MSDDELEEQPYQVDAEESPEAPEEPEDIFSGSIVQAELSADEAYLMVVDELKQEFPEIEQLLANDPELAQSMYNEAFREYS